MLATHVFAGHRHSAIHFAWAGGRRQVQAGRHALHEAGAREAAEARRALILSLD